MNPSAGDYTVTVSGTVYISGASTTPGSAGLYSAANSLHPYTYNGTGTIQLGANAYIHTNSGTSFGSGLTINNAGFALTFSNGAGVDSLVSGSGAVNKGGGGTVAFRNDSNSYTGKTSIDQGTLSFTSIANVGGGASALGAPATVANGTIDVGSTTLDATLRYLGTTNATSNRTVNLAGTTGNATIDISSTGNLTLATALTATGGGNKTLILTGASSGIGTLQGGVNNLNGSNITSLAKSGSGQWVLTGSGNMSGSSTISGGTLQIGGSGRLGNAATYAGAITFSNNATLQFSTSTSQTFSGAITGSGNIIKDTNTNDLTLNNTSNNLNGTISVSAGRVVANDPLKLSSGLTSLAQSDNGQFYFQGANTFNNPISLSGLGYVAPSGDSVLNQMAVRLDNGGALSNTITLAGNSRIGMITGTGSFTSTISGQITGGFGIDFYSAANGNNVTNTFVVSNSANNYGGDTSIYSTPFNSTSRTGISTTLKLGASNVIPNGASTGNVVFATFGGNSPNPTDIFDLAGFSETINGVVVNPGVNATITNSSSSNASILQVGDNNTTSSFGGSITDSGGSGTLALAKIGGGTLTLNGTNSYNGTTTVSGGTLALGSAGSIGNTPLIHIASGATLDVSAVGGWSLGASQTLGGNGTIVGALTISGNLNPGNSPGLLTFSDATTLAGNTTMEIDGVGRGTEYDGVNTGTGLLTYGGNLTFAFGNTFAGGSYTFDLFSLGSGNQTGDFASVVLTGNYSGSLSNLGNGTWERVDSGNTWTFSQATGDLTFIAVPEPTTMAILGAGVAFLGLRLAKRRQMA